MKFCLNRAGIFLLALLLLCVSCGDADLFDTDRWSNKVNGWEPGIKGVVARGEFSLWDLINQGTDSVIVKEGNSLYIQYLDTAIYTIDIDQVFKMEQEDVPLELPTQTVESPSLIPGEALPNDIPIHAPADGLSVEQSLTGVPAGCVLSELEASAVFVYPETEFSYYVKIEFPDIKEDGKMLVLGKEVPAHTELTDTLNPIVLSLGETQQVKLVVKEIIIRAGSILNSKNIDFKFGLNSLSFIKVAGKISAAPIKIEKDGEKGHFNMDVDFLDEIGGQFTFARPELNIIVRNQGIGVPLEVAANFEGKNSDGKSLELSLKPGEVLMTRGNVFSYMVPDTLGFNYMNSNIAEFLSLPPTGDIYYGGNVYVNPERKENNVVYHDGKIVLDAYVKIPFELSAENLTYKDTLDDIDIDQKYADKIKYGNIEIYADNGLPLNIRLPHLTLLSEDGGKLVLEAEKDNQSLPAKGKGSIKYKLATQVQTQFLGKTKKILLEVNASTPDKDQAEEITADAKLSFRLLVNAQASIEDLDDF